MMRVELHMSFATSCLFFWFTWLQGLACHHNLWRGLDKSKRADVQAVRESHKIRFGFDYTAWYSNRTCTCEAKHSRWLTFGYKTPPKRVCRSRNFLSWNEFRRWSPCGRMWKHHFGTAIQLSALGCKRKAGEECYCQIAQRCAVLQKVPRSLQDILIDEVVRSIWIIPWIWQSKALLSRHRKAVLSHW